MIEVVVPAVGVGMTEGLLVRWIKEPGDPVTKDEPVAEIETDKATMELVSPETGRLGRHLFEPGTLIPVGVPIVRVLEEGEVEEAEPGESPSGVAAALEQARNEARGSADGLPQESTEAIRPPHRLSPRARRLARERGDRSTATPRIAGRVADDVPDGAKPPPSFVETVAPAQVPHAGKYRQLIAALVARSWETIPHFSVARTVNAEGMFALVEEMRESRRAPVTMTDLLLRAFALACRDFGYQGSIDLGLAVATDGGVVVLVIRSVLDLDLESLCTARQAAVERARGSRLTQDDLEPAPVSTVSNLGSYGIDHFTGIIPLGQASLLTLGRASPRVFAEEGRVAVRTTFEATLNVDHRVFDGVDAARLLSYFASAAEDVARLKHTEKERI